MDDFECRDNEKMLKKQFIINLLVSWCVHKQTATNLIEPKMWPLLWMEWQEILHEVGHPHLVRTIRGWPGSASGTERRHAIHGSASGTEHVLYIVPAIAAVGHHPYTSRQLGSNTFLRRQLPESAAGDSTRSGSHPVPTTCIALSLAFHVSRTPTFRQHLALCTAPPYRAQQSWHRRYTLRKASLSPPIPRHLRTMPSTMCGRPHMTSHSRRWSTPNAGKKNLHVKRHASRTRPIKRRQTSKESTTLPRG